MASPGVPVADHFAVLCDARADSDPNGVAIGDSDAVLTNRELLDRVVAASELLREQHVTQGDVIALRLPNGLDFVVFLFAAWRIGCVVTPINPGLLENELQYQLSDSKAVVVVDPDGSTPVPGLPVIATRDISRALPSAAAQSQPVVGDEQSLALLIYTSGTTGQPKGVMLTHANIVAMASMGAASLGITHHDRSLLILPLFHVNGIVVSVLTPMLYGGSTFIAGKFDSGTFFDLVEKVRPTYFSGVPTIYAMLNQVPELDPADTVSLRFALCGAAPAPHGLLDAFEARFGTPVVEGYGLSEGTCATTVNPWDGLRKPGTVGLPMPGQRVRIAAEDGSALGPEQTGEVQISGANVMVGYLGKPDDTRATLVDGWLKTGDLGHLDADDYLVIDGRVKDMIIRGGENIYPREIEDALAGHRDVTAVAVVGKPDQTWGEIVAAFLTIRSGADEAQTLASLKELCEELLAPYKRPTVMTFLPALPLNPVGKIDKLKLRAAADELR